MKRTVGYEPDKHLVDQFDCGNPELNTWLRVHARHAAEMRTAHTHVLVDADHRVLGYYAVASHAVVRSDAGQLGRGSPDPVPAFIIGKLALDLTLQGRGLGSVLLADVLGFLVHVVETGPGARLVVADAIDDRAAEFYLAHGFTMVAHQRLMMKISKAAASLAE